MARFGLIIPYANFAVTAMVLSDEHLRENIKQSHDLHRATTGRLIGYLRHPTVIDWFDHEDAIRVLHDCCVRQLIWRGRRTHAQFKLDSRTPYLPGYTVPYTIGNHKFHAEHRVWCMFKQPSWYEQWGWTDEPGRTG